MRKIRVSPDFIYSWDTIPSYYWHSETASIPTVVNRFVQAAVKKNPMKVFYIEDDLDEIDLFMEAISVIDTNIECAFATSGQKGLVAIELIPRPDIIFLDFNMPKLNGYQCLLLLKNHATYKEVPIIIYTSMVAPQQARSLYEAGALKVIRKENTFKRLCDKLRSVFLETGMLVKTHSS